MSDASARAAPVAVFGGTFNPVHYGHLRSALELVERLGLAELRLMPSARPPHREEPGCSAEHRLAMVELAVAGEPRLTCDGRELERSGKSFTISLPLSLPLSFPPASSLISKTRPLSLSLTLSLSLSLSHYI